jgi:hypothetical protein
MVGMSMSDNGSINIMPGVNEETSRLAIEAMFGEFE